MLLSIAFCAVASAMATSANHIAANTFMDQVFDDMRVLVPQNGLDPLKAVPFTFIVKSNAITNRDLKANFTQGMLMGLSTLIRLGDCSYGTFGVMLKLGCYGTLFPIHAVINAEVTGDSIFGSSHEITTATSVLPKSLVLIEVVGYRGDQASLTHIGMVALAMNTTVIHGRLDLNAARFKDFENQLQDQLANQLTEIFKGTYGSLLQSMVRKTEVTEANFSEEFLQRMIPRLDWPAFLQAANKLGVGGDLPSSAPTDVRSDAAVLQAIHHALLEVEVMEGELICPETQRRFPITNGIPNMLLNEDEI
ncbi:hypothetical protein BIW11_01536 [Tropilaelaps mercedesae]|uniref:Multifunctional methyltransferase subunit TRM112-like protein n=1 Tax=Tropilaelaps mercedesae TaxID=418985 RepID=A0A1V9XCG2_9ACAR|nr:hypothetical protein BIW11_01536 [Tropilaelaps mercedesae]